MRNATKFLVGGAAVAIAVFLALRFGRTTAPPPGPAPRIVPKRDMVGHASKRIADALDLQAPDIWREEHERVADPDVRAELRRLLEIRGAAARASLETRIDELSSAYRYVAAVREAERYRRAWSGTALEPAFAKMIEAVREEQREQVAQREQEANRLLDERRFEAAREALLTAMELEEPFRTRFAEFAEAMHRRIRVRQHVSTTGPGSDPTAPPLPVTPGAPPPPPALPGFPHPDVKRLADARDLLASARELYESQKYGPAAKALTDLTGYFGDLTYVKRRHEAVGAVAALARHKAKGLSGLFNATKIERRNRRVKLTYTFADQDEYLDWEPIQTIPHKDGGQFRPARGGLFGDGVATMLLRGFFDEDVEIRATSRPNAHKSHGLVLCQAGLETRHLMWLVTNHWFVEGENYVKPRPGHSILMFGKGVNNDVPLDSPEVGFIFRGSSITKPEPRQGASLKLSFSWRKDQMAGEITIKGDKGKLSGSAKGDDGRGVERLRPGLFVVQNAVLFTDIVIQGRLDKRFERERVAELLNLASTLD